MAQKAFRAVMPGVKRPDAVMYCLGALQKFEKMKHEEVQKIGFEIGMMAQKGLDTNDATPKHRLKNLPGQFSGLHLLCYMYVAFKKVAPDQDIGFDLSKEYELAKAMQKEEKGG